VWKVLTGGNNRKIYKVSITKAGIEPEHVVFRELKPRYVVAED